MSRVRFGDIVTDVKKKVDRNNNPYEFYVAGDHMDTEDLEIHRKGKFATDDVGPAFIREFKAGQILYGSRRTYLKKVAVADFDGVTANTTFVLETSDDKKFLQELLPFVMLSEGFTQWSIMKSKGSTNPYVLFSDLADYEFELPDIEKQRELANVLWAMDATKRSYKNLLLKTDELVKSQFRELFGGINEAGVFSRKQWKEVLQIINGRAHKTVSTPDGKYPICGTGGIMGRATDYLCPENTVVMGRKGTIDKPYIMTEKYWNVDTAFGVVPNKEILNYVYLFWYCKQLDYTKLNKASTLPSTTKADLLKLSINIPPLELQEQFAAFVRQSDKSKFELEQALEELIATSKKIISENLS